MQAEPHAGASVAVVAAVPGQGFLARTKSARISATHRAATAQGRGRDGRWAPARCPPTGGVTAPRTLRIPTVVSSRSLVAKLPRVSSTRGPDQLELGLEVGTARGDLIGQRIAVARGPALDHVGDVDLAPVQAGLLDQQPVEECARAADEGAPLQVLLAAGPLAHDHELGVGGPLAEDHRGYGWPPAGTWYSRPRYGRALPDRSAAPPPHCTPLDRSAPGLRPPGSERSGSAGAPGDRWSTGPRS